MKKSIFIALMCSVFVYAQNHTDSYYSQAFHTCMKEAQHPNGCLETEIKQQDKKLNKAYKDAKKSLPPSRIVALKKVQRSWIHYRDAKCGFFYHKHSGSGGLSDKMQCILDTTIQRTIELNAL